MAKKEKDIAKNAIKLVITPYVILKVITKQ